MSAELISRITAYLSGGGLFNPELAIHDAVRDLLIDCRTALSAPPKEVAQKWKPIETAPKDGTWILGVNNRGNCAVIIWSASALSDRAGSSEMRPGWIHPFSDGRLSTFWNGGCGSVPTHWMPLPITPYMNRDGKS
jgi:hypothetical protein